ncbi:MAG TPA: hypothetical protein VL981_11735 [Candidatus Methylacidiphilales bacterium]|nr:hypothetical protein [Candidatus Methylacidiphilales bacterium]
MKPGESDVLSREEFETFLRALTHEIRNRLNGIALEAADFAEQTGTGIDASRLQRQIQDCSTFLKAVRDMLASDSPQKGKISPAEAIKKWREQKAKEPA